MAGTVTNTRSSLGSLGKTLAAPFVGIGRFLITLAEASPRMRQLEKLGRMSDADLQERGLTREDEIRRILGVGAYL